MHLGQHAGGGNRKTGSIALHHRLLRARPINRIHAVDQQVIRAERQPLHRLAHGQQRSLADIDAVDRLHIHSRNRPGDRIAADLGIVLQPLLLAKLFGIIQTHQTKAVRKDHRRGHHRPEHRSAAHFVQPRNAQKAQLARSAFQLESAYRGFGHAMSIETQPLWKNRPKILPPENLPPKLAIVISGEQFTARFAIALRTSYVARKVNSAIPVSGRGQPKFQNRNQRMDVTPCAGGSSCQIFLH